MYVLMCNAMHRPTRPDASKRVTDEKDREGSPDQVRIYMAHSPIPGIYGIIHVYPTLLAPLP